MAGAAVADIGQHEKNPVFIVSVGATRIDDIAAGTFRAAPDDLARLGFAVAHALDAAAPSVEGLDEAAAPLAARIAAALLAAAKPLLVCGTGSGSAAVLEAAANIALALRTRGKAAEICLVVPEVNSLGAAFLQTGTDGRDLDAAFAAVESGAADTLIVLENDLYRRAERSRVDAVLGKVKLIVIDHQSHATATQADVLLSCGTFAESDGTVVNNEGRAQRYFQVYDPAYYAPQTAIRHSWAWLADLQAAVQERLPAWRHVDEVTAALAQAVPGLGGIVDAAPNAKFRIRGLKVAREPHRYSGRTAMRANLSVHEPRQPQDADTALAFSMEGHNGTQAGERPGALIPFAWAPGWNSPQSWNKFQDEVGGHLHGGDPGVRLIGPAASDASMAYVDAIPPAFGARAGAWTVVPLPADLRQR